MKCPQEAHAPRPGIEREPCAPVERAAAWPAQVQARQAHEDEQRRAGAGDLPSDSPVSGASDHQPPMQLTHGPEECGTPVSVAGAHLAGKWVRVAHTTRLSCETEPRGFRWSARDRQRGDRLARILSGEAAHELTWFERAPVT